MAEAKKAQVLSKEEVEKLDKKDIVVAEKASDGEVEAQDIIRICPSCGVTLRVIGTPSFITCCNCWETFHPSPF